MRGVTHWNRTRFGQSLLALALGISAMIHAAEPLPLQPIVRIRDAGRAESLAPLSEALGRATRPTILATQFLAVVSTEWIEGLVPVFRIEREDGALELRRLPARGVENSSEPIFFALPRPDEPQVTSVAGRWECVATNSEGSKHYVGWELAIDGERVAGRLDQHTDYRFAFVTGGSFRSNQLNFTVEYINDRYTIYGSTRDRVINGRWQQIDGENGGLLQATRPRVAPPLPRTDECVPLFEWQHKASRIRRYAIYSPGTNDWEQTKIPLCLVWPVRTADSDARAR